MEQYTLKVEQASQSKDFRKAEKLFGFEMGSLVRYSEKGLDRYPWAMDSQARHFVFVVVDCQKTRSLGLYPSGYEITIASYDQNYWADSNDLEPITYWNWKVPYGQLWRILHMRHGWRYACRQVYKIWWARTGYRHFGW